MTCPVCGAVATATNAEPKEGCPQCGADLRLHVLLQAARDQTRRKIHLDPAINDKEHVLEPNIREPNSQHLTTEANTASKRPTSPLLGARFLLWTAGLQAVASLALLMTTIALGLAVYKSRDPGQNPALGRAAKAPEETVAAVARDVTEVARETLRLYSSEREERVALAKELASLRASTATATLPPALNPTTH